MTSRAEEFAAMTRERLGELGVPDEKIDGLREHIDAAALALARLEIELIRVVASCIVMPAFPLMRRGPDDE